MRRGSRRFLLWWAACLTLLGVPGRAFAQDLEWSPERDSVLQANLQAMRDQRYADAEKLLTDAIRSAERSAPNPQLAYYLDGLAGIYRRKGNPSEVLNLVRRALENDRSLFGPSDMRVAYRMTAVANALPRPKEIGEVERLFKQAAEIARQAPNTNPLGVGGRALVLSSLGSFYVTQGRQGEAVQLFEFTVMICEGERIAGQCDVPRRYLEELYQKLGRVTEAERLPPGPIPSELARIERRAEQSMRNGLYAQAEVEYRSAIQWIEQNPSARMDGQIAFEWEQLGRALERQGRNGAAEEAYKKALSVHEARVNPRNPRSASGLAGLLSLMNLYRPQGRVNELEPMLQHWLEIQQGVLGPNHAYIADSLALLARVYEEEGKADETRYSAAAAVYERIIKIQEANFGPDARQLATTLGAYAGVLRKMRQDAKAAEVQARADTIRTAARR